MDFNREQFSNEELIYLYRNLLLPRMIEEKMLVLQKKKQGIFDAIMQDATQSIESLTWEDVKGLLA